MSQCKWMTQVTVCLFAAMATAMSVSLSTAADPEPGTEAARLATYKNGGKTTFALSLRPRHKSTPSAANELLIMFDTSASQAGLFRKDAVSALKRLVSQLNANDRVKLVAVDVNAVDLNASFVAPGSAETKSAMAKLAKRVPLGSTDMMAALRNALAAFDAANSLPRHVIYIGDGMSKASVIDTEEFTTAIQGLTKKKISFSSYAIGPDMDIALLAAIANQTGGNIIIDTDEVGISDRAADFLVSTARGTVYWPGKVS
ncbi:MAG: VWA domain-containing protein, partial [Pirellulaceae bacterium]|nr:VWA domain-containing protein [Pirellulaceae bacterium]